jgi:hypothetical protein
MKKVYQIAALVIVIGGIFVWWLHIKNDTTEKAITIQAKEESTRKAIIELADKYNAVVNWSEPLSKKPFLSPVFTIEVEDALLRKDNRPVLFLAKVGDVERKENKYLVRFFSAGGLEKSSSMFEFILDCSDEQVSKIIQQQIEYGDRYAVIAAINKVKKLAFEVTPVIEGYGEDAYSSIEIDTPDTFVATGRCIDLLFVKDYDDYDFYYEDKRE